MKYIITESMLNKVLKQYMDIAYGDIKMSVEEYTGVINFFSRKDFDEEGYPLRLAFLSVLGTLWVEENEYRKLVRMFGILVKDSIKTYFEEKFNIEIKKVRCD